MTKSRAQHTVHQQMFSSYSWFQKRPLFLLAYGFFTPPPPPNNSQRSRFGRMKLLRIKDTCVTLRGPNVVFFLGFQPFLCTC